MIRRIASYAISVGLVIVALAGFALYELRRDSSLVGGALQALRGNQVGYSNLTITLPSNWVALHSGAKLMLINVASGNRTQVFFQAFPTITSQMWEQNSAAWIESRLGEYRSEGYEIITSPEILANGQPATCIEAASHASKEIRRMECVLEGGRTLATYSGVAADIPPFVSMLGSLRSANPHGSGISDYASNTNVIASLKPGQLSKIPHYTHPSDILPK